MPRRAKNSESILIEVVPIEAAKGNESELLLTQLGQAIKSLRKERSWTQQQLGSQVGVDKAKICKLERNPKNVTVATLLKVFTALNTNVKLHIETTK